MLRDVVHSKNFDDGAVVHRHPLFDSTRETNTTPRRNSVKKTKRRRTSSSTTTSSPSLPLSRLSLSSSSSLWWCLLSFDFWKRLVYPNPKKRSVGSKTWAFFVATKIFSILSQEGDCRKRPLSLFLSSSLLFFFFFFFLSLFLSPSSVSLSLFQVVCVCSLQSL